MTSMRSIGSSLAKRLPKAGVAWGCFLAGLAVGVWRAALAIAWARLWLDWKDVDPSGAELYEVNAWVEVVLSVVALVAGLGSFLLVRRRSRGAGRPSR